MKAVFTGFLCLPQAFVLSQAFSISVESFFFFLHGTFLLFKVFIVLILHSTAVLVSLSLKVKASKLPMQELPLFLCTPLTLELQRLRGTTDICLYGCDSGISSQILTMNMSCELFPYAFCFVRVSMYSHVRCSKLFLKCDHNLFCLQRNLKMLHIHAYKIIGSIWIV